MLADDESVVRSAGESILQLAGLRVTTATNGMEVIDTLEKDNTVNVLVLDLTMPVLSGRETIRRISSTHPDLPVIVCTGHLMDSDLGDLTSRPNIVDIVQKPFRARMLLQIVGTALELQKALRNSKRPVAPNSDEARSV